MHALNGALIVVLKLYIVVAILFTQASSNNSVSVRTGGSLILSLSEPPHGKTNNLHMRKQRRRSASR